MLSLLFSELVAIYFCRLSYFLWYLLIRPVSMNVCHWVYTRLWFKTCLSKTKTKTKTLMSKSAVL